MFTSVRSPRVYEHIVEQIERAIFGGRLSSGDRLPPERELVRQFRASRVAVREALRTLEHRGLVDVRHGASGGHFVREADTGLLRRDLATLLRLGRVSVGQLTEARLLIEPAIARLAAERAAESELKVLAEALEVRALVVARGEHPRLVDIDFHRRLAAAAGNPVHAVLTDALMGVEAEVVVPRIELSAEDNGRVGEAHAAILAAVAARAPQRAQGLMAEHIVDVQRRLGRVESTGQTPPAARAAGVVRGQDPATGGR
jgi:DNA-binding FadR family transcriptional regulator